MKFSPVIFSLFLNKKISSIVPEKKLFRMKKTFLREGPLSIVETYCAKDRSLSRALP